MTATVVDLPARLPVVILFAETRGFTRTSALLEPAVVLRQAEVFFELAETIVRRNGGAVRNRLNDTLMACFSGERRAHQAVQCAQELQRDFGAIEDAWARDFGVRAAVAIGLHAGDAVIGGGAQPMTVGDSVSIAERLLHRARAGEFVLSGPLLEALGADAAALEAEPLPALEIARREPIALHGVLLDTRLDFT
jgi:class 3 adenylate cyclase